MAELLQRYAEHRDAEAFARIVEEYQRLVLATCRRTLRNAADVDDAVQETFLRLAQRAKQLHSNLGGWLHQCALTVSIDINRRRETRRKYEAAALPPSNSGEEAQRELSELREHLDAALLKLDPEMRELIVQRFFVGRSQIELAEEAGVAASTISERMDRAIAVLRKHLQATGCAAVGVPLVGLLATEHSSAAVTPGLSANLMKIGLGGVSETATVATGFSLMTLFLTAGSAVAGCVIIFAGIRFFAGQTALQVQAPATRPTAVTTAPSGNGVSLNSMRVSANGERATPGAPNWQAADDNSDAVFAGRVIDKAGKPIANATVILSPGPINGSVTTDENGRFALASIDRPGTYQVGVKAEGFLEIQTFHGGPTVQLAPDSRVRRDIVMDRGVLVEVHVVDLSGTSFADVDVDAGTDGSRSGQWPMMRSKSDKDGKVTFTLPVTKTPWVICGTSDNWAPSHTMVTPKNVDQPQPVELKMDLAEPASGVAICKDGKPAAGWEVYATPDWWSSNYLPKMEKIDKDGNFTLTQVGEGNYQLWISIGNSSRPVSNVKLPTTQPIALNLPMMSPSSQIKVTGRVAFEGKRPQYIMVQVDGEGEFDNVQADFGGTGRARNVPRDQAQYSLSLPPGTYMFQFQSDAGFQTLRDVKIPGDIPLVTLKTTAKPRLAGNVVDAATNAPITHFAVRLDKTETIGEGPNFVQDAQWTQVSNPDGHFDVELVGAGIYKAQISADGYAWLWSDPARVESGTQQVTIKLTLGGSLAGTIVDPTGKSVAGAKVIPLSMARSVEDRSFDRFDGEAGASTTDSSGAFTLNHLAGGEETLKVVSADFAPLTVPGLKVVGGKTSPAGELKLDAGASVEGTVYDNAGAPAAGMELQFQDADGYGGMDGERVGRLADVHTDENGHYRVDHLGAQLMYVNLQDRWNREGVDRRLVHPTDGKTSRLDFGGTSVLRGRMLAKGAPLARQHIELAAGSPYFGGMIAFATTDADGKFAVNPPPGHYTLYIGDANQNNLQPLRDVDIAPDTRDLGDIDADRGSVIIDITADDPDDVKSIKYVNLSGGKDATGFAQTSTQAHQDGDHWVAKDVPVGKFDVYVSSDDANFISGVQRKAGADETSTTVHLKHRGATLSFPKTLTGAAQYIRSEDGSVQVFSQSGKSVKVPAGTYHVMASYASMTPRPGTEPIVLRDGDAKEVSLPDSASPFGAVTIYVWDANGAMVSGAMPKLLDEKGNPFEGINLGEMTRFTVSAGKYRAVLERPGLASVEKDVDATAISGEKGVIVDLFLP